VAAEHTINTDLKKIFTNGEGDLEKLKQLLEDSNKWPIGVDEVMVEFAFGPWVNRQIEKVNGEAGALPLMDGMSHSLELIGPFLKSPVLWRTQNVYFSIKGSLFVQMLGRAEGGEEFAKSWVESFLKLGNALHIKV
jgi:hypothetical protein